LEIMRMRIRALALPLAAGLFTALAVGAPASADTTGTTPVTFEVTGGALNITVPTGTVNLGSVPASTSAQTVSAQLGDVTVTDDRDGTTGWTVTASATDFTGPQNISVSAPGSSSYVPGPIATTGTVNAAGSTLSPLYPPGPVVTATGVSGVNTATWNPTISVTVPAGALVGTYSSTVTHDVD
jgi:hypothetical protein